MSQVTIHHPSSYGKAGTVTFPQLFTAGTSQTLNAVSLKPSTQYTIDWGDGTANTQITTDGNGAGTTTHTYAKAGNYTALMYEGATATGIVVGRRLIVVLGTIASDGTVTAGQNEAFSAALLPNSTAVFFDWGDGSFSGSVTTSGTGTLTAQNHNFAVAGAQNVRVSIYPYPGGPLLATGQFAVVGATGPSGLMALLETQSAPEGGDSGSPEISVGYDPGAHTVQEVEDYVTENPDQRDAVWEAESEGKARVTLLTWLENFTTGE